MLLEHHDARRRRVFAGVRERDRKAIWLRNGAGETYDLAADPYELASIDDTSGFRAASKEILLRLLGCRGEECWAAETDVATSGRRSAGGRGFVAPSLVSAGP